MSAIWNAIKREFNKGGSMSGGGGRKPPGRRRSGWYEGGPDFNRDPNTPQFSRVWGTCMTCGIEGFAKKTMYNDAEQTVYYTCEAHGCRDNFAEHEPTHGKGLRGKQADKPIDAYNERDPNQDRDFGETSYRQGRDPTKGRSRSYVENGYCTKCHETRECTVVENVDTGVKNVVCNFCGRHWTERN